MNIATVAGQAAAVILIVNTLQQATGFGSRWFGFVLAILISLFAWFSNDDKRDLKSGTMAFLGGFVVYAAAFGGNALTFASRGHSSESVLVEVTTEVGVPAEEGEVVWESRTKLVPRKVEILEGRSQTGFTTPW